jgi:hypothetical protein
MSIKTRSLVGVALAVVVSALAWAHPGQARAAATCTWGGTPTAPTGSFTITPGLTNVPTGSPLRFVATGQLSGADRRCRGPMKWVGQIDAGSTCAFASFEGAVRGLSGVARFWGRGSLLVPSHLYDKSGNVIGIENAQIVTQRNLPTFMDCTRPGGFTGPTEFSSVVELYQ